jgi:hypothetical protein
LCIKKSLTCCRHYMFDGRGMHDKIICLFGDNFIILCK